MRSLTSKHNLRSALLDGGAGGCQVLIAFQISAVGGTLDTPEPAPQS